MRWNEQLCDRESSRDRVKRKERETEGSRRVREEM